MTLSAVHQGLLDAMPDGVVVSGSDGSIVYVSPTFVELSGYTLAELRGRPIEVLVPESRSAVHERHRAGYQASGSLARPMGAGLEIDLRRADGVEVPVDIALSRMVADGTEFAVASVRDVRGLRRSEARLRAINEVAQAILTGGSSERLLHQVAASAARMVSAQVAMVIVAAPGGGFVIRSAVGEAAEALRGKAFSDAPAAEEVIRKGEAEFIPDALHDDRCAAEVARIGSLGSTLVLPLWIRGEPFGALVVANQRGQRALSLLDLEEEETFAAQAAVAIEYARAGDEIQRLALLEDRERIARELHDTVIQRLFAAGMTLQAAMPDDGSPTGLRVAGVIDSLDEVIGEIRTTIFALDPQSKGEGLRSRLLATAREFGSGLGFQPTVRLAGPIDSVIPDAMAENLVATLREALSNVSRHAGARSAEVFLHVDDEVVLTVIDDGSGPGASHLSSVGAGAGRGLANLAERADKLGGTFAVTERPVGGTEVVWRVPLAGVPSA